jgi:hypothetical protein
MSPFRSTERRNVICELRDQVWMVEDAAIVLKRLHDPVEALLSA